GRRYPVCLAAPCPPCRGALGPHSLHRSTSLHKSEDPLWRRIRLPKTLVYVSLSASWRSRETLDLTIPTAKCSTLPTLQTKKAALDRARCLWDHRSRMRCGRLCRRIPCQSRMSRGVPGESAAGRGLHHGVEDPSTCRRLYSCIVEGDLAASWEKASRGG